MPTRGRSPPRTASSSRPTTPREATGVDATTYRFDGVKGDAAAVGAALTLLRGIVGDLTLSQRDIDRERDQVSAQTRAAGNAQYRIFRARAAFLLGGDAAGDGGRASPRPTHHRGSSATGSLPSMPRPTAQNAPCWLSSAMSIRR